MTPDTPSDPELSRHAGIAVAITGGGPPLVMLHGLPGSHRDFRWLAPVVEERWTVIRPDLPGFGQTPASIEPSVNATQRADVAIRLLDALGHDHAVFVGHSFGGVLAASLAARHPSRCAGVVLLASPGLRAHRSIRRLPFRKSFPKLLQPPWLRLVRPAHRALFRLGGFPPVHSDESLEYVTRCVGQMDFDQFGRWFQSIRAPTAVVWAEDDRLVEPEIGDELSRTCPDGPRLRFETGGHNLQKTRAVEIGKAIETLGELSGIV